ncbi:MAG: hypothetical protein KDB14_01420 [Planctomycetales bacterium]|nr:hypothetical protein [Planctomycetales bacterium]
MPVSVVLSQSPRQDPARRDFEEQLVTMLIMEDAKEVHVVSHLEHLRQDDTGRLCLEGLTAHVIALTWLPPAEAFGLLQQLGVPGRFGRTSHTREAPEAFAGIAHPRAIYCLNLSDFETVDACREEVGRIDREQAVQVFSIGLGTSNIGSAPAPRAATVAPAAPPTPASKPATDEADKADRAGAPAEAASATPRENSPEVADADAANLVSPLTAPMTDWDDAALDQLVDELDEMEGI